MAATAADVALHIGNWLRRSGFPVRDYAMVQSGPVNSQHAGEATPGEIMFSPRTLKGLKSAASRYGRRGALNDDQLAALNVATHEALHQMRYGRTPEFYQGAQVGTPGGYEEGAVQATTEDVMPAMIAQLFGMKMQPQWVRTGLGEVPYRRQVQNVRQLSVFGSGAGSYTDRKARVWRRSFLHADPDVRQGMVSKAQQARVAWGQKAGR